MSLRSAGDVLAHEILYAYGQGIFPMAESRDDPSYAWYRPKWRGIIPMDSIHISRSLKRAARKIGANLRFAYNVDFEAVIDGCAAREDTWINPTIRHAFLLLYQNGYAHSFEVFNADNRIGGVYGLALGGAFFGESMFSSAPNGSKFALAALVKDLRARGFTLFDTQFLTPHLESMGGQEITDAQYCQLLEVAIDLTPEPIPNGTVDALKYFSRE